MPTKLRFEVRLLTLSALCVCATAALAENAQPDPASLLPPVQIVPDVPAWQDENLTLADLPRPTGRAVSLFNGRDLKGFTPWLGKPGGGMIMPGSADKPLGRTGIGDVFRVVQVDGAPAIYVSGRTWGSLNTRRAFSNYHLSLYYKFGQQWSREVAPNSGILYHSYGKEGAFVGTWMNSIEYEVAKDTTGMMLPVGADLRMESAIGLGTGTGMFGGPDYRYMAGGKRATLRMPTQVRQSRDVEKPMGEWNRLDLYAAGDKSVHVVNGVPVLELSGIKRVGPDGKETPLTGGMLQFQSEGTEIYFRDIKIEPIRSVPTVVIAQQTAR